MSRTTFLTPDRGWLLYQAAADFFYLQNRSYPREAALELTGNRYRLDAMERMLLSRGLFSQKEALSRRSKRNTGSSWRKKVLFVDGHNVQITIESCILSRPLLKANDGAMRDLAGQSARFQMSETGKMAMDMIFRYFEIHSPGEAVFLFDQPMSRSGELAAAYRERLKKSGIRGEARAVPVPEKEFPYEHCTVASSDRAVLDCSSEWIDLACRVIEYFGEPEVAVDFSRITLFGSFKGKPPSL